MPDIYGIAKQFRANTLNGERAASAQLYAGYVNAYQDIQMRLDALIESLNGSTPQPAQLVRLTRFVDLMDAIQQQIDRLAQTGGEAIATAQRSAITNARAALETQLVAYAQTTGVPFAQIYQPSSNAAIDALIGLASDGSPLGELLNSSGQGAAQGVSNALQAGIARGANARVIARDVRNAWGVGMTRALALARTETMRAFRTATLDSYAANSDVIERYEWLATNQAATCAACLALDGMQFELDDKPLNHVNCRCTIIPVLRDDPRPMRTTGAEWLEKQDTATKIKVLGPKGLAAYQNGTALSSFVHVQKDKRWGDQAVARVPKE